MSRFTQLYNGTIKELYFSVAIENTAASPDKPSGTYLMTTEDCRELVQTLNDCEETQYDNITEYLDVIKESFNKRWFTQSAAVSDWLNKRDPVVEVYAHIGQ